MKTRFWYLYRAPDRRLPTFRPYSCAQAPHQNHPLVTEGPEVRSYAGAPSVSHDGHELGALCAVDQQAHDHRQDQLDALADLADLVMHAIELRLASRRAILRRR